MIFTFLKWSFFKDSYLFEFNLEVSRFKGASDYSLWLETSFFFFFLQVFFSYSSKAYAFRTQQKTHKTEAKRKLQNYKRKQQVFFTEGIPSLFNPYIL